MAPPAGGGSALPAARLPMPAGERGRVGPALAAVSVLLLAVLAVPVLLLLLVGSPLPSSTPTGRWLTEPLDRSTIQRLLSLPVWLLWLHLLVCLVVEVRSERRGTGLAPPVPGGAVGTQALARWGVDGLLSLRRAPAAAPTMSSRVSDQPPELPPAPPARSETPPAVVPVVTPAMDGATSHTYYEVRPPEGRNYETLWDIAERFLGSGTRHREILELNRGVVQPDGTTLRTLELVRRGWILRMPADAEGRGLRVGDQPGSAPDDAVSSPETAGAEVVRLHEVDPVTELLGLAPDLLAAELVGALRRERTAGPGTTVPIRSGDPGTEWLLRRGADTQAATLLGRALAAVGGALAADEVPTLRRCVVGRDRLTFSFSAPLPVALHAPWHAADDGVTWSLRRSDGFRVQPATAGAPAFAPVLVTTGRQTDGRLRLLDLAAIRGLVSVSGHDQSARDVALSWAIEAAVRRRTQPVRVTMVGFAQVSRAPAPRVLQTVDSLDTVLVELEARAQQQCEACDRRGVATVAAARLSEPSSRSWSSELVVLSGVPDADSLQRLQQLATRMDTDVSVVVVGDCQQASERFSVSASGQLWNGPLGVDVPAQRLTSPAYERLAALFSPSATRQGVPAQQVDLRPIAPRVEPEPAALDPRRPHEVEVGVLGAVAVDAHGPLDEDRRELLTELVVLLAEHPQGVHVDEVTRLLHPAVTTSAERDRLLSDAARWLGEALPGRPRIEVTDGAAQLLRPGIRVDRDVFAAHVQAAQQPQADRAAHLKAALDVVRGDPFTELRPGGYAWLTDDAGDAAATVEVVLVARQLAAACAERGDGRGARDAVRTGLAVAPAAEDLWVDALRLAASLGGRRDVEAVHDEMMRALHEHGSSDGPSSTTLAVVDGLLPGRRGR